ncbi:GAF domain-containing protein, partial [Candidatus Bipolaricaulota bacterium]|nr:GAF domain-containing protein [Candidatus Bipolaricaulota bacterium]
VGIYMRQGEELVLAAWDGPEATQHMRIPVGQGICGLADCSRYLTLFLSLRLDAQRVFYYTSTL